MTFAPGYPVDLHGHPTITEAYEIKHQLIPLAPMGRTFIAVPQKMLNDWARQLREAGCDVRVNPVYGPQERADFPIDAEVPHDK